MKKSIKNLEVKIVKNIKAVKGAGNGHILVQDNDLVYAGTDLIS